MGERGGRSDHPHGSDVTDGSCGPPSERDRWHVKRSLQPHVVFQLLEEPERLVVVAPGAGRHVDDLIVRAEETELDRARSAAIAAFEYENHRTPPNCSYRHESNVQGEHGPRPFSPKVLDGRFLQSSHDMNIREPTITLSGKTDDRRYMTARFLLAPLVYNNLFLYSLKDGNTF